MIQRLTIKNFKKFEEVSFELGTPLVLVGPNNSGKTSLLQAITLLDVGLRKIASQPRGGKQRTGIAINRRDLASIPIPTAKLLWFQKNVRQHERENGGGLTKTKNILIEIVAEGFSQGKSWTVGLEFDYANDESFYVRLLRKDEKGEERHSLPPEALLTRVAYLQPMSGLASQEDRLTRGSVDRKIGEGKTADVIRNICYQLLNPETSEYLEPEEAFRKWDDTARILKQKFGLSIQAPVYYPESGLLEMKYTENGVEYDLTSAGRGFQQTLLLLCYLFAHPNSTILMDEPDAHLEVLRQREIYQLISDVANSQNSQLIIASHSEVVLSEAAAKGDQVVAVIEQQAIPLIDRHMVQQVRKSLTEIGWERYYKAKLKKHILFFEGETDDLILQAFAKILGHPLYELLPTANVDYLGSNQPNEAFKRFAALKVVVPDLKGVALFDNLYGKQTSPDSLVPVLQWQRCEVENYFLTPELMLRWAGLNRDLFSAASIAQMQQAIENLTAPIYLSNRSHEWWSRDPRSTWGEDVFREYFEKRHEPMMMRKGTFHHLIDLLEPADVEPEIIEKLDTILQVFK
ncbi:MAG: AAA family ATPase [Saprospiraceae bacterium]|nr:AAA family ATPase [Saprospiraceae bacterium]